MRTDYTREELIAICEQACVQEKKWRNRDTPDAQAQIGKCWAFLKAGCEFKVSTSGNLVTTARTIWIEIFAKTFASFEEGAPPDSYSFYLPTNIRLEHADGNDWY